MTGSETRAAFIQALFEWLEQERAILLTSWHQKGVAPIRKVQRVLTERKYECPSERSIKLSLSFELEEVKVSGVSARRESSDALQI